MRVAVCVFFCILLAGCGAGTNTANGGSSPSNPVSDYAAPNHTIFIGDIITQDWPLATSAAYDISLSNGTASGFDRYADDCVSGCTAAALQTDAPGMKRLVISVGEFDALQLCFGDAINNPSANFSFDLEDLVGAAHSLFGLEVWLGTVPPIYNSNGTQICATQTASINQQIVMVGAQESVKVVDFASVLPSSADTNLTLQYAGQNGGQTPIILYPNTYYLPNAAGFAAMTTLYNQKNQ